MQMTLRPTLFHICPFPDSRALDARLSRSTWDIVTLSVPELEHINDDGGPKGVLGEEMHPEERGSSRDDNDSNMLCNMESA
jgi:hypothetical protein